MVGTDVLVSFFLHNDLGYPTPVTINRQVTLDPISSLSKTTSTMGSVSRRLYETEEERREVRVITRTTGLGWPSVDSSLVPLLGRSQSGRRNVSIHPLPTLLKSLFHRSRIVVLGVNIPEGFQGFVKVVRLIHVWRSTHKRLGCIYHHTLEPTNKPLQVPDSRKNQRKVLEVQDQG